jgi:homogentisate 1,2-dioxygenase
MIGFHSILYSEAIPNALPLNQNNPQKCPFNLYVEQLSGTSFTRPRANNRSVWLYRTLPSCATGDGFRPYDNAASRDARTLKADPNPGRWHPLPEPTSPVDFVDGLRVFGQAGDPAMGEGLTIYQYAINKSMENRSVSFGDGEILLVPQSGKLNIKTELGLLSIQPEEICVIPRGVKWTVAISDGQACHRGYAVEVFNEGGFRLPELGVIGANGLANPMHFEHPTASFETKEYPSWENIIRVAGEFHQQVGLRHSPFNVVAWKGNLIPYKYNLGKYNAMNSVTFDHPDPSIFTVLTVPTATPGVAACDFVIFPSRWMVANHTFRPPYFHRNCMTEFMGLIRGGYDGKKKGFVPGGASLHNRMVPHGPDSDTFELASNVKLEPFFYDHGLAFMFESAYYLRLSEFARNGPHRELDYANCWRGLARSSL